MISFSFSFSHSRLIFAIDIIQTLCLFLFLFCSSSQEKVNLRRVLQLEPEFGMLKEKQKAQYWIREYICSRNKRSNLFRPVDHPSFKVAVKTSATITTYFFITACHIKFFLVFVVSGHRKEWVGSNKWILAVVPWIINELWDARTRGYESFNCALFFSYFHA